ncbi:MAG: AraC family transcriptional regulator, partial [Gammaproteobacteria bacterium]|nr:AraC family transcriptional regulator [Gammaproteobacteria bacterium]
FSIENSIHFVSMMLIELIEFYDELCLDMASVYPADDLLVYLCDRFASSTLALLTVLMKSMVENTKIDFPFGREDSLSQFAEEFGCQVRFDQPRFKISMLTAVGKTELPNADQILWSQITTTLAKNMPAAAPESEVVIKVRRYIQANLGEAELNVAKVATSMFMSERTLRRRLTENETSFREVLSQEREKRARDLLVTGKLSMTDIAVICGYADTSSLRRCLSNGTNEDS